ncbi:hypothetical protein Q5H93_14965 [Hymenobacter sp. ASUV-10]|uniref:Uncharacterized protein n=1 Tax=Hymenobacter aranciens TaxID=3063996 RepID=A0ABT9BHQ3_9BACT|nr:hypothetical protein [Hymenobacter sp. ASUV-10]MDO7876043.1 hypothetical protein [Hymenobacter sp. ASUV-10]
MKIGKQFNTLTYHEYLQLIENRKRFTDFNTLGLFRSIVETTKLSLEEKLELRQLAIATFAKTFDFLQLKDPRTFFEVSTLGETLTKPMKVRPGRISNVINRKSGRVSGLATETSARIPGIAAAMIRAL